MRKRIGIVVAAIDCGKYEQIKDGLTVEYHGLIRYEYTKI